MHVVTDAERREVARRLRMSRSGWSGMGWKLWLGPKFGAVVLSDGNRDELEDAARRLADLIEPSRGSGGRTILCAHCENVSWCGCESGDREGGCDFEPSVTEGEPPYNLYSLYEVVFRRRPRYKYAIDDDEVDELVDALLDICNAPGHERIQRSEPSEPQVRCVAEVKVDGERLEKLAHDAAVELSKMRGSTDEERDAYNAMLEKISVELHPVDREALLALADELEQETGSVCGVCMGKTARRIRKALGVSYD